MPETFTSFPALSIDPVCIGDRWLIIFLTYYWIKSYYFLRIFTIYVEWRPTPNVIRSFSVRRVSVVCKQLTSILVSRVSCLSPWIKQNFPALLKIEQTLSHRWEYKYLSWMYGVDRKICHEGHWSASRGLPSDAEQWSRVTDFSIHTIHPW